MAEPGQIRTYVAFISYRHLPLDRKWAQWLLESLERFRTPRSLVRQGYPRRLAPLYRDEDEVPASANLSRHIEQALDASRAMVVVCTPETPHSRWIDREVRYFQEAGRGERIHVLLADGEPESAFPRALLEDGGREPVAADVRPRADASKRRLRRFARLRIAAALLGCTFDDLRRRERQRTQRRIAVAALAALLVAGLVGWLGTDYLRRQENLRMAAGMLDIEQNLRDRSLVGDSQLRAAMAFDLLPDRNWLNAPIPRELIAALLPVVRSAAVTHVQLDTNGAPTRLAPGPGYVLVGTERGALLRVADAGTVEIASPAGCPAPPTQSYQCAVTAIGAREGRPWAIGIVGGMVQRSGAGWIRVSRQRIDQLRWLRDGALLAVDGAGRLYRIAGQAVEQIAEAGGVVTALLEERDGAILLVRARGVVERLRTDRRIETVATHAPRLVAAAFVRGRLTLLREPPPSSAGDYPPPDSHGRSLIRLNGGRWTWATLSELPGEEPPPDLYAVSPDDAYAALRLLPEPVWQHDFRDAVIGFGQRSARAPSGRYLYRLEPVGFSIIDLERLWALEDVVRAGGNLRAELCAQGLARLFAHRFSRPRSCPA